MGQSWNQRHHIVFFFVNNERRASRFPAESYSVLCPNKPSNCVHLGLQNVRSLCAPDRLSSVVTEFQTHDIDVLCLTETWIRQGEVFPDYGLSNAGLNLNSWPRSDDKRGGGLAILHKNVFSIKDIELPFFESFEQVTVSLSGNCGHLLTLSLIYRPPSSSLSKFIVDFDDFLERLCTAKNHLILGDFNLHMDDTRHFYVKRFSDLLCQYQLEQFVRDPTHSAGHTIDLIITRDELINSVTVHDYGISDHSLILCKMNVNSTLKSVVYRRKRDWKNFNSELFAENLYSSELCDVNFLDTFTCVSSLVDMYNDCIISLIDHHAPFRTSRIALLKRVPWFSQELREAIRERRRLESLWRRTRSDIHRSSFVRQRNVVKKIVIHNKRLYYKTFMDARSSSPSDLWRAIKSLVTAKNNASCLPTVDSDDAGASSFARFFSEKIRLLQDSFSPSCCAPPICAPDGVSILDEFDHVSVSEVVEFITNVKSKTSPFDPVPTWVVKKFPTLFAPVLCAIANLSLSSGIFPDSEKRSMITPVIKNMSLCKEDYKNYRPISVITFVSKLIETVMAKRIDHFLFSNNLVSPFQSAYRRFHSTETVILHLCNHIAVARNNHMLSCMIMLDLSSAFDSVNHTILLHRLFHCFNISGTVLQLFSTYLKDRSQSVRFNSKISQSFYLPCGVPQGSVLGPRLYSLYVAPIAHIIDSYDLFHHMYADDTCLYLSFSSADVTSSIKNIENCIAHVCDWFNSNLLRINGEKTKFILFNSHDDCPPRFINVSGIDIYPSNSVRYLGVTLDSCLSFEPHIINVCKSSFAFVRTLYRVRSSLPFSTVISIVNTFIFSRIDYCNSVFSFCSCNTIGRLQRVQNCLARLVKCLPRRSPTSAAIKNLSWLRIMSRVDFKILCLTHKCIYGSSPSYVNELLSSSKSSSSSVSLRSHSGLTLFAPISRYAFVRRAFSFKASRLWNALPLSLRQETRFHVFKRLVKAQLL